MSDSQLKQLKDFMEVYNKIAEICFNHCVHSFADRSVSNEEAICADHCVKKYVELNQQVMRVYVEIQPSIIQRRMEEMSKVQESAALEVTNKDST